MKQTAAYLIGIMGMVVTLTSCHSRSSQTKQEEEPIKREVIRETLYDKSLPEIKKAINGRWELISGQNARETGEFENTFITFKEDTYIWSENGTDEPGDLNWRKGPTGAGYDSYLMDVFYAERPAYLIAISGDSLYIQDISDTGYKYLLIRK